MDAQYDHTDCEDCRDYEALHICYYCFLALCPRCNARHMTDCPKLTAVTRA